MGERSGEADQLFLARRKTLAAFPHRSVEAIGQFLDEVEEVHLFGCVLNLVRSDMRCAQADIAFHGSGEKIGVLENDPEMAAEIDEIELPSMAGYGDDTCTTCRRCGSSVSTDPMFGAHITRKPWPPQPADESGRADR